MFVYVKNWNIFSCRYTRKRNSGGEDFLLLMEQTVKSKVDDENVLPQLDPISENIAPIERPDKIEAIKVMRTRFKL